MLQLVWAARTHAGSVRQTNQDAVLAEPGSFVVADGMGGHEGGEVASMLTVDVLRSLAMQGPLSRPSVLAAVREADERLKALGRSSTRGMGTTVCGLFVTTSANGHERLGLVNVGDSRGYRLRGERLTQLTHDHSVVQELIDAGTLDVEGAETHPERHVITRSLGSTDHLDIDWWTIDPERGDRFLLSSDGLTKELTGERIRAVLLEESEVDRAAQRLLDEALHHGGRDNISVVLVDVVAIDQTQGTERSADPLNADTEPRADESLDADTAPVGHSPR